MCLDPIQNREWLCTAHEFELLLAVLFVFIDLDAHLVLIGIVIHIDEPIVEQESRIALLPIRVEHLLTSLDVLQALNDKPLTLI